MITAKDIRRFQDEWRLLGTEFEKNVGAEVMFQRRGQVEPRRGIIVQVQKMWGANDKGKYVWGIPGYTVYDIEYKMTTACKITEVQILGGNQ